MSNNDGSTGPLWPFQVLEALGENYSAEDLAATMGLTTENMVEVLQNLEQLGYAKLTLAPICANCGQAVTHFDDPDEIPEEVSCRVCDMTFPTDTLEARMVYILIKWPAD